MITNTRGSAIGSITGKINNREYSTFVGPLGNHAGANGDDAYNDETRLVGKTRRDVYAAVQSKKQKRSTSMGKKDESQFNNNVSTFMSRPDLTSTTAGNN